MKVKEKSEKAGLKLNIQKTKMIASNLITSWQTDGETMQTVTDFIFLSSKITADGDCSHEIKTPLLFERKAMINLDSILKSRDFSNKGPSSQSYGFSSRHVWIWELDHKESWALKNWCFWTVVLEKTLESPLNCKEIQPVHPKADPKAETPIVLAIWCEELTHWKRPWFWERLKAGGEGDDWGWDGWMASPIFISDPPLPGPPPSEMAAWLTADVSQVFAQMSPPQWSLTLTVTVEHDNLSPTHYPHPLCPALYVSP